MILVAARLDKPASNVEPLCALLSKSWRTRRCSRRRRKQLRAAAGWGAVRLRNATKTEGSAGRLVNTCCIFLRNGDSTRCNYRSSALWRCGCARREVQRRLAGRHDHTIKIFIDIFIGVWAFILAYVWTRHIDPRRPGDSPRIGEIWERFPKFVLGFAATFLIVLAIGLGSSTDSLRMTFSQGGTNSISSSALRQPRSSRCSSWPRRSVSE